MFKLISFSFLILILSACVPPDDPKVINAQQSKAFDALNIEKYSYEATASDEPDSLHIVTVNQGEVESIITTVSTIQDKKYKTYRDADSGSVIVDEINIDPVDPSSVTVVSGYFITPSSVSDVARNYNSLDFQTIFSLLQAEMDTRDFFNANHSGKTFFKSQVEYDAIFHYPTSIKWVPDNSSIICFRTLFIGVSVFCPPLPEEPARFELPDIVISNFQEL